MSRHVPDFDAAEERLVCLSTGHYTRDDDRMLAMVAHGDQDSPMIVHRHGESGFFIPVYDWWFKEEGLEAFEMMIDQFSTDLLHVLEMVVREGFAWVLFDKDGPVVDGLELFDW